MESNKNVIWAKWANNLGTKLIDNIEIKIGNDIIYDSSIDPNKKEKIKLLSEIENFRALGLEPHNIYYLNSDINDIRYEYELLKYEYTKLKTKT